MGRRTTCENGRLARPVPTHGHTAVHSIPSRVGLVLPPEQDSLYLANNNNDSNRNRAVLGPVWCGRSLKTSLPATAIDGVLDRRVRSHAAAARWTAFSTHGASSSYALPASEFEVGRLQPTHRGSMREVDDDWVFRKCPSDVAKPNGTRMGSSKCQ